MMVSDIVQRLRDRAKFNTAVSPYNLLLDAAEELESAEKAEALMREHIAAQDRRIAETRAAALEAAAKLIQATADEYSTKGRDLRGGYSDRRFYAVMGARLNESAAAIRALIPEREG